MRSYPALDVTGADADLLLAVVDDFSPTAVDDRGDLVVVFFTSDDERQRAREAVHSAFPGAVVATREVSDEDWARRSQENLQPITVGLITVAPPWAAPSPVLAPPFGSLQPPASSFRIVITPSMGFGTGHHATTRLCLAALQDINLGGLDVLDVGTGSGVLALAARSLGAASATGLDYDADAVSSAEENLALNPGVDRVRFVVTDFRSSEMPSADVVTANLTGALLVQSAPLLLSALRPGGTLIVSGLQTHERDEVTNAFAAATLVRAREEAGWMGLVFNAAPFVPG